MSLDPYDDEAANAELGRLVTSFSTLNRSIVNSISNFVHFSETVDTEPNLTDKEKAIDGRFKRRIGQLHNIMQKLEATKPYLSKFSTFQENILQSQTVRDDIGHGSVIILGQNDDLRLLIENQRSANIHALYSLPISDLHDLHHYCRRSTRWLMLLTASICQPDELGITEIIKSLRSPNWTLLDRYPDRQYPWLRFLPTD